MPPRTIHREPIAANVYGFSEYSTLENPHEPNAAPVFHPEDLINKLRHLQSLLSDERIVESVKLLYAHIGDTNNPHNTSLAQFKDDIVQMLYDEYIKAGGTGTLEYYSDCLFKVLRVASLEEMATATDPRLLVSVLGARQFIQQHERSDEAHKELFEAIFPGDPISFPPIYAVFSELGVSPWHCKPVTVNISEDEVLVPYTYVNEAGLVLLAEEGTLPVDYTYDVPTIPRFGLRKNFITESNNFNIYPTKYGSVMAESELSPDNTITGTAFLSTVTDTAVEHSLIIPDVELIMGKARTLSVYLKAEVCRFAAISYRDLGASPIQVRAIFDLRDNSCIISNGMQRYHADIVEVSNGWHRCSLSMFHNIGQINDVTITFFKEQKWNGDEYDLSYTGNDEVCGYLWGLQLEDGFGVSPYIPTNGFVGVRAPIDYVIDLQQYGELNPSTIYTAYLNPRYAVPIIQNQYPTRPVLSTYDGDKQGLYMVHYPSCILDISRFDNISIEDISLDTVVVTDVFAAEVSKYNHIVHTIDSTEVVSRLNEQKIIRSNSPDNWTKDKVIYLGSDRNGNYLDSYMSALQVYDRKISDAQTKFLVQGGENV